MFNRQRPDEKKLQRVVPLIHRDLENTFGELAPTSIPSESLKRSQFSTRDVLMLQRTIGNQATQTLIQRLPLKKYQGKENLFPAKKLPLRVFGGRNLRKDYISLLKLIKKCEDFANLTLALSATATQMHSLYTEVIAAAEALRLQVNEADKGAKEDTSENQALALLNELLIEARREQSHIGAALFVPHDDEETPKWSQVIAHAINSSTEVHSNDITGHVGGAINQLAMIGPDAVGGYFKRNIEKIPHLLLLVKKCKHDPTALKKVLTEYNLPDISYDALETMLEQMANAGIINEQVWGYFIYNNPNTDLHGVDTEANLARRDVATSRLNDLLNAGVIAHTEMAMADIGGVKVEGSLMAKAEGHSAFDVNEDGTEQPVNARDPNLVRLLSRLQLLDALAHQIDRHAKNYYIQFDKSGNVVGVTGIDNDMSFGLNTSVTKGKSHFHGVSLFVDAELANSILDLDPQLLHIVMEDLLNPSEIEALLTRLAHLKLILAEKAKNNELLTAEQWGNQHINALLEQGKKHPNASYYGLDFGDAAVEQEAGESGEKEKEKEKGSSSSGWSAQAYKARAREEQRFRMGAYEGKGKEKEEKEKEKGSSSSGWSVASHKTRKNEEESLRMGAYEGKGKEKEEKEKEKDYQG